MTYNIIKPYYNYVYYCCYRRRRRRRIIVSRGRASAGRT